MPTIPIPSPKDLEVRDADAANRAGFDREAEDRYARIVASGETIPWQEMRAYLEDRIAGSTAQRPTARHASIYGSGCQPDD